MDAAQTHLTLSTGAKMPVLGFGLWKIPTDQCAEAVYQAIKAGYRCLDGACDYGNEVQVGEGIKKAIDEGLVKREDLWITSKLWNTFHRKEHVQAACEKSMKDLGVDYLDLYLIHFPISLKYVPHETRYPPEWIYDPSAAEPRLEEDLVPYQETWQAMEALQDAGLVKNIGCSNIGVATLRDVLSYCKHKPTVLQVELHPYNTMEKLLRFCKEKDVKVTAYSSFGAGSYIGIDMATKEQNCLEEALIKELGSKYSKSPAQVVLRWAVQRGTAVIPKSVNPARMAENAAVFDFALTEEEMASVSKLNQNLRFNDPGKYAERFFNVFYPIYE